MATTDYRRKSPFEELGFEELCRNTMEIDWGKVKSRLISREPGLLGGLGGISPQVKRPTEDSKKLLLLL